MKIHFNRPVYLPKSLRLIKKIIQAEVTINIAGDGYYGKLCEDELKKIYKKDVLLTSSCTHALEMAAILINLRRGDEVIVPSYTFVTTALAFEIHGAKIRFVDIDAKTGNISLDSVNNAINKKTKAVVAVHYGGNSAEMDKLSRLCRKKGLFLVEDAAQAIGAKYKGKLLGTFGDLGTLSFHETKNITSGEGGALIINNKKFLDRAKIIREKGTNRAQFKEGLVDKYSWVDLGSSYIMSDLNAAYLYPQIKIFKKINKKRLAMIKQYKKKIKLEEPAYFIETPRYNQPNGHLCAIVCKDNKQRQDFINFMKDNGVITPFHYVSLHTSPYVVKKYHLRYKLPNTDKLSECLVRLPLYYGLKQKQLNQVINLINYFFSL